MKFRQKNDLTVNGVRSGFSIKDTVALRRETDHTPKTQILAYSEDDEEPEERTYWCAVCKSRLEYLKDSDTIWRCDNCMEYYDTKIQDSPIKDNSGFKVKPHSDLMFYPTEDAEDIPFVQGINPDTIDEEDQPDIEIVRTSADRRIQHIHVKCSPERALRLIAEQDKRKQDHGS
jgi:ribosomal protein L37AE/L43A